MLTEALIALVKWDRQVQEHRTAARAYRTVAGRHALEAQVYEEKARAHLSAVERLGAES